MTVDAEIVRNWQPRNSGFRSVRIRTSTAPLGVWQVTWTGARTVTVISSTGPLRRWQVRLTDGTVFEVDARSVRTEAGWVRFDTGEVVDERPVSAAVLRASVVVGWVLLEAVAR